MATIPLTGDALSAKAPKTLTRINLSSSDTFTYTRGSGQILLLTNTTASEIMVNISGTAPQALSPDGYGGSVTTTGGKSVAVPANGCTRVALDGIWAFLTGTSGTVTVANGTGLYAVLYN